MKNKDDKKEDEIKDEDGETLPVDEWPELEEEEDDEMYDESEYV